MQTSWVKLRDLEYIGGQVKTPKTFKPDFFSEEQWYAVLYILARAVDWRARNRAFIKELQNDILKYMINAFMPSKTVEQKGKEVYKTGFLLKRPSKLDYMRTLMVYGFFPFESPFMGIRKGISIREEGEEFGLTGSLAIMWDVSGSNFGELDIDEDAEPYIPVEWKIKKQHSTTILFEMGVIHYLISLAKQRGDYVTLIVTPAGMVSNTIKTDDKGNQYPVYIAIDKGATLKLNYVRKYMRTLQRTASSPQKDIYDILLDCENAINYFAHYNVPDSFYAATTVSKVRYMLNNIHECVEKLKKYFPALEGMEKQKLQRIINILSDLLGFEKWIYKANKVKDLELFLAASITDDIITKSIVYKYWTSVLGKTNLNVNKYGLFLNGGGIAYPYWILSKDYDTMLNLVDNIDFVESTTSHLPLTYHGRGTFDDWLTSLMILYDNAERIAMGGKKPTLIIFTDMRSDVWEGIYEDIWREMVKKFDIYIFYVSQQKHQPIHSNYIFELGYIYPAEPPHKFKPTLKFGKFIAFATDEKEPISFKLIVKGRVHLMNGKTIDYSVDVRSKYFKKGDEIVLGEIIAKKYGFSFHAIATHSQAIEIDRIDIYYYIKKPKNPHAKLYLTESILGRKRVVDELNSKLKVGKIVFVPVFMSNLVESVLKYMTDKQVTLEYSDVLALEGVSI